MAPIILGNSPESGVGNNVILADTLNLGAISNIIVPYKDQYRVMAGAGGVAIGNTADTRVFSTGTVIVSGTNVTIGTSALGALQYLNLSIADPAAAANYISAGDYVSLSTAGFGTTVSVTGLQPAGAYLTTAALSDHDHGGTAFVTGSISGTIGTYSSGTGTYISGTDTYSTTYTYNGWSLSIPDFLTTAALSNHSHTEYAGTGVTTGTTLGTDVKATLNTSGLSFRTPRYITTAAQVSHIHGSISTVSTTGSLISYSSSSNGLTLGVPQWITTAEGINNVALSGNTSGTITEMSAATITIAGGDNITLSQDGNAFTIMGAASGTNAGIAFSMSDSNTTGTKLLVSNGTLFLEGGNNVTVSQNSNTIQIAAAAGAGAALQGSGTYTQNTGTIQFANSNNFTFGLTNNQMTASFSESTHDHPYLNVAESTYYQTSNLSSVFLTTAALSNHAHSEYVNTSITSQWLTTALPPDYTSHSHTEYLTTAMLSENTSVFFYTSASSLLQHTSATSAITSAAFPSANTTKFAGSGFTTTATAGTEVVGTLDSLGLKLAVPAYLTTAATGGGGGNWSTSTQAGSNIDISTATDVNTLYYGNFLTVAAGAGAALKGSGTYTQNSGTIEFANSNGLTFGLTDNQMTASYSQSTHAHDYVATSASSLLQHTSATSAITSNALNTSVSSVFQLTADNSLSLGTTYTSHTHTYLSSQSNQAISGSNGSSTFQTISFGNSNSNSFYLTNGSVVASFSQSTHAHPYIASESTSVFQLTSDNSLSLGTVYTSHTHNYAGTNTTMTGGTLTVDTSGISVHVQQRSMYFADSNNITFGSSVDGYSTTLTASANLSDLTGSYAALTHTHSQYINTSVSSQFTTQSYQPVAFSGSNSSTTASTISFGNSNGLSFYLTNGSLVGSYSVPSGVSGFWELEGTNTAGTTGSEFQTLYLSGGQNVTLEGSSNTIIFNVNATGAQDGGNVLAVSGSTASSTGTVAFWNANSISFGFSESTRITASFSQSTHDHPSGTLSFINTNGVSFISSSDGSTTSISASVETAYIPLANSTNFNQIWQISSNTSGTSSSSFGSILNLIGGNNITLSGGSDGISIIGGAGTGGDAYIYAGDFISLSTTSNSTTVSVFNTSAFTYEHDSLVNSSQTGNLYIVNSSGSNITFSSTVSSNSTYIYATAGGATGTAANGTLSFINTHGVSFISSSSGSTTSVSASVQTAYIPLANSTNFNQIWQISSNTSGTSSSAYGSILKLVGSDNITLSGGSDGISIIGAAGAAQEYNYITLYGNTSNASTASGSSILLSAGNNITLAASGGSIKIEGAAGGGGVAIADTASTVTNNTVVFSNSNGVSFGLNGSTITASYTVPPLGTLSYINTNGVSFISSSDGSTTSISASVQTAYIPLANSTDFNQIWYISGNIAGTTSSSFGSILRLVGSNNITLSGGSNGISIIGGAGVGGGTSIVPGDYLSSSLNGSTLSLSVTGLQATSATSAITSNAVNTSQSSLFQHTSATSAITASAMNTSERGNYFYTSNNTFANSTHSHGNISIAGTNISATTSSASSGMTLSLSVADPGAAEEYNYISLYGNTSNASTVSGSSILLSAGNNITLAVSNGSVKIEGGAGGGGVAIQGSGTYIHTSGTAVFQTGNGMTFGLSNNGVMTGSYTVPPLGTLSYINTNGVSFISSSDGSTTSISASVQTAYVPLANSTNFVQQVYLSGNTGGTSSSSVGSILKLAGGANITLSMSTNGYVSIIGGGGGGGTSIVPGSYLSSSLNGSTLSLSVTGLQATSATSAITANAVNTSFLTALQYTSVNSQSLGTTYTSHTHNYMGTGISTSGNITVTANTVGLSITAPTLGYLYFSNTNGHSWSSSTNGVSTSIWIYTA